MGAADRQPDRRQRTRSAARGVSSPPASSTCSACSRSSAARSPPAKTCPGAREDGRSRLSHVAATIRRRPGRHRAAAASQQRATRRHRRPAVRASSFRSTTSMSGCRHSSYPNSGSAAQLAQLHWSLGRLIDGVTDRAGSQPNCARRPPTGRRRIRRPTPTGRCAFEPIPRRRASSRSAAISSCCSARSVRAADRLREHRQPPARARASRGSARWRSAPRSGASRARLVTQTPLRER